MDISQCVPQLITATRAEITSLQGLTCTLEGGKVAKLFPIMLA